MEKEKSKAVTTIDVLFDEVQRKKMCCVKSLYVLFLHCVCVSEPAAREKNKNTYMGLSQQRQQQDKQQRWPQPHDDWLRHALYYS